MKIIQKSNSAPAVKGRGVLSLRRLEADRLLGVWRKKNATKLKGWDAVKAVRALRGRTMILVERLDCRFITADKNLHQKLKAHSRVILP